MTEFAAIIDHGVVKWPVEIYKRDGAGNWSRHGVVSYHTVCPCVNPNALTYDLMADALVVKMSAIHKMEMIRVGKTDLLGDAGWLVYMK